MKIQPMSQYSVSFSFKAFIKKGYIVSQVINKATKAEKRKLCEALGLTSNNLKNWHPEVKLHGMDIIEGEILPNISVISKGVSPIEAVGNIVNVELARIRGQLKKVPLEKLNF